MDTAHNQTDMTIGLHQAKVATKDQELENLKARSERTSIYLANAEQQLIESQSLISLVLSEAEDKLRWAASIDRALHTMHGVLAERDATIKRQETLIAELEGKVSNFDARIGEKAAEAQENAMKVTRMQQTFSWKATAPFRFLRRTLIDKKSNG